MTVREALGSVRYVVDSEGKRTEAILPLSAWRTLLELVQQALEDREDNEDLVTLQAWLGKRSAGKAHTVPLEDLVAELEADGLV